MLLAEKSWLAIDSRMGEVELCYPFESGVIHSIVVSSWAVVAFEGYQ